MVTTKAAIEPVWHLPGIAKRFGVDEVELRRTLYEQTGGMFPELVTRPDIQIFLPPINGLTIYMVFESSLPPHFLLWSIGRDTALAAHNLLQVSAPRWKDVGCTSLGCTSCCNLPDCPRSCCGFMC